MKYWYATQAEIPEALRSFYVERDGKWVLNCEGAAPIERVTEFRDRNIALDKELKDLKKAWDGFDVEEVKMLVAKKQEIADAKIKSETEFTKRLDERIGAMKVEHDKELKAVQLDRDTVKAALSKAVIEKAIIEEAGKLGVRAEAIPDVLARGLQTWKLNDQNEAVAMDGDKVIFGTDAQALKMSDWTAGLLKTAPHLFNTSQGGGSPGGGAGNHQQQKGTDTSNPWKRETYSLRRQGEITRENFDKAVQMANEAGHAPPVRQPVM